jgi:hypothetical protein
MANDAALAGAESAAVMMAAVTIILMVVCSLQ